VGSLSLQKRDQPLSRTPAKGYEDLYKELCGTVGLVDMESPLVARSASIGCYPVLFFSADSYLFNGYLGGRFTIDLFKNF
jgi:hypothetical protein